jgi:hypothetical protein
MTETESSLRNAVFLDKNRMMDNVQKLILCIYMLIEKITKYLIV